MNALQLLSRYLQPTVLLLGAIGFVVGIAVTFGQLVAQLTEVGALWPGLAIGGMVTASLALTYAERGEVRK